MTDAQETFYPQRFDSVEGYLHHRTPYLLLDQVDVIEPMSVRATTAVSGDAFYIQGHFPGAHVLPGAMMQEMTTQAGGVLIAANFNPMETYNTEDPHFNEFALGVLVKIKFGRYRGFARPGDALTIDVTLSERVGEVFDFVGKITCQDKAIYRNEFQLTNMRSDMLRG